MTTPAAAPPLDLDIAIENLSLAISKTEEILVHFWNEVQRAYVATNNPEPFAEYIQRAIPRFDLITILRAVFSTNWAKVHSQGNTEVARRRNAVKRLGLQEDWELFLWFGPAAVNSQRCWVALSKSGDRTLTARQLFDKVEKCRSSRSSKRHYLEDVFRPRDFQQAVEDLIDEDPTGDETTIDSPKILDENTIGGADVLDENTTGIASLNENTNKTNPARKAVIHEQITNDTMINDNTSDETCETPETDRDQSAHEEERSTPATKKMGFSSLRKRKRPEMAMDDSAVDLKADSSPSPNSETDLPQAVEMVLQEMVNVHDQSKITREEVIDRALEEWESEDQRQGHVMVQERAKILSELDVIAEADKIPPPGAISSSEMKYRAAAGQKRKATQTIEDLEAKKQRMEESLEIMYREMQQSMRNHIARDEKEASTVERPDTEV